MKMSGIIMSPQINTDMQPKKHVKVCTTKIYCCCCGKKSRLLTKLYAKQKKLIHIYVVN